MLPDFPIGKEDEIDTVVQPDMSVICDSSKIMDKGCLGAPDLIIEILSPSTSKKDLYEKHGVKEYWIVDPGNRYFRVFHLREEKNHPGNSMREICFLLLIAGKMIILLRNLTF
ncbi:MAG: hypothetical protein DRZ90_06090 [Spirochaetes bacterium]|nr:MAG: hypothetical protein DRZ90_06090 [Spirochaetota bacterium]